MERLLHEATDLREAGWRELADNIITRGYDIGLTALEICDDLAYQVVRGTISVRDIGNGLKWVRALDREIIERYEEITPAMHELDFEEAVTRRLCLQTGQFALQKVKCKTARDIFTAQMADRRRKGVKMIVESTFSDKRETF